MTNLQGLVFASAFFLTNPRSGRAENHVPHKNRYDSNIPMKRYAFLILFI